MSTTAPTSSAPADRSTARPRWPYAGPGQKHLLLASLAIGIGSFLPWVDTVAGSFTGLAGPGVWTLYAAVLGLAGAMLRRPRVAAAHAAVTGVVAIAMPAWQGLRLLELCPGGACAPGLGLLVVAVAGVTALLQAPGMWRAGTTATG